MSYETMKQANVLTQDRRPPAATATAELPATMGSLRGKLTMEDCISMDETVDLGASLAQLGLGGGPLLPLSPNAMPCGGGKAPTEAPAAGAAKAGAPSPTLGKGDEADDSLGALPSFRSPAKGGRGRRPDPRRQSLALSSMFAAVTSGAGLLDDSEIAVGDEDVQV